MTLPLFVLSLWARLRRAFDRWRVRRFIRLGLPVVRDGSGQLALPESTEPLLNIRIPPPLPTNEGTDYVAASPSLRWLGGEQEGGFRLAATRVGNVPLQDLSILRLDVWPIERARSPIDRTPRPTVSLGLVNPEIFGVDEDTTRLERSVPPPLADEHLARLQVTPIQAQRLPSMPDPGVLSPTSFGLAPDATPASETHPLEPIRSVPMARARASFLFRYVDPLSVERILPRVFHAPTESLEQRLAPYFERPDAGAGVPREADTNSEVTSALDEVREQFQLRRGIGRAEMDNSEMGSLDLPRGFAGGSIKAFTGLEFEHLQPEPIERLRLHLENPPVDMAPFIEAPTLAYASLVRALSEFPPDGPPPPVPVLPSATS